MSSADDVAWGIAQEISKLEGFRVAKIPGLIAAALRSYGEDRHICQPTPSPEKCECKCHMDSGAMNHLFAHCPACRKPKDAAVEEKIFEIAKPYGSRIDLELQLRDLVRLARESK